MNNGLLSFRNPGLISLPPSSSPLSNEEPLSIHLKKGMPWIILGLLLILGVFSRWAKTQKTGFPGTRSFYQSLSSQLGPWVEDQVAFGKMVPKGERILLIRAGKAYAFSDYKEYYISGLYGWYAHRWISVFEVEGRIKAGIPECSWGVATRPDIGDGWILVKKGQVSYLLKHW